MTNENTGYVTLLPAYGRNYATVEQALHDWNDGMDFKVAIVDPSAVDGSGPYTSIRDAAFYKTYCTEVWIDIIHTVVRVL